MGISLLVSQDHIPVSYRTGFLILPFISRVEPLAMLNFRKLNIESGSWAILGDHIRAGRGSEPVALSAKVPKLHQNVGTCMGLVGQLLSQN